MSTVSGTWRGPNIVKTGLVLYLDASAKNSYNDLVDDGTWKDISGNGNNGTLINGPTFNSGNGGSIVFDGTTQYATASITPVSESNMTFSFFFRSVVDAGNDWKDFAALTTTTNTVLVFEKGGNNGFPLTNGFIKVFPIAAYNSSLVGIDLPGFYVGSGNICNFTLTANTSSWALYGNGMLYGSGSVSGSTTNVFNRLTLANDISRSGRTNNCQIYNVQIYNRALTATEITQNFNATRGRFGI
jgi:hypothetical protein